MIKSFEDYTSFKGRATRMELVVLHIVLFVIQMLVAISVTIALRKNMFVPIVMFLPTKVSMYLIGGVVVFYTIATLLPVVATNVRRLHDMNFSGWWLLVFFIVTGFGLAGADRYLIPNDLFLQQASFLAVNLFYFIVLFLVPGTKGKNKYGRDELEINAYIKKKVKELKAKKKLKVEVAQ